MPYTTKALQEEVQKRVIEEGDHLLWTGTMTKGMPQFSMITNRKRSAFMVRRLMWDWAHPDRPIQKNERVVCCCEHERCIAHSCLRVEKIVDAVHRNPFRGRIQRISKEQHQKMVAKSHASCRARSAIRKNPQEAFDKGLITAEEAARLAARNVEKAKARAARYERIRASGVWMGRGKGIPKNRRKKVEISNAGSGNDGHETV